jgi:hypothetical protein
MRIKALAAHALALAVVLLCSLNNAASLAAMRVSPVVPVDGEGAAKSASPAQRATAGRQIVLRTRGRFATIQRAAICTEDLAEISFQEYSADWSCWMSKVATRWATVMNSQFGHAKMQPSAPLWVELTCARDGSVSKAIIHRSSGDQACDKAQMLALQRCLPLPAFPVESRKRTISLMFVWDYAGSTRMAKALKRAADAGRDGTRVSISGKLM